MSIKITCKNCHAELEAEEEYIGTECQCPVCNAEFIIENQKRNILKLSKTINVLTESSTAGQVPPMPPPVTELSSTTQTAPEIKRSLAILFACAAGPAGLHLIYIKQYKSAAVFIAIFLLGIFYGNFMILSTIFISALHAVCFGRISDEDFQKEFVEKKRGWFLN